MIIEVDEASLYQAALVHSIAWKDSHRAFCSPEFIEKHSAEHQFEYLKNKMSSGSRLFMMVEDKPTGIVSITGNLIEDLYVLPDRQNMGVGTKLLMHAIGICTGAPVLWILENNEGARRLYLRLGFRATGRTNKITDGLSEVEYALTMDFCRHIGDIMIK